ncbi:protein terminal ear1 homolog [Magnolia sinica]|uniref:protein terminal ear1 homolog n=1 Tax=Magnolia sinica TaxID=86752 RepID=UPI0026598C0E|nr:protein terminal ear1 homolog [Magnolia sinica]
MKMLNPKAPSFEYYHLLQRRNYSLDFSYLTYPAPSTLLPYFYPFIQTQRPSIYDGFLTYFPRLPQPPTFLSHSLAAISSNEGQSCKGVEMSFELPAVVDEIPTNPSEPTAEKTVAVGCGRFRGGSTTLSRCFEKKSLIWRPKVQAKESKVEEENPSQSPISPFEFVVSESEREKRTTVMIKNIPNRYSRSMLLELLDRHCAEENEKAQMDSDPSLSEYDFVYLPIDFKNKCNLGYAFVNFTTTKAAARLYKSMNKFKWAVFDSRKICEIFYARIQGKDALVEHFQNSFFKCDSDEFLPVLLSPPRNGSTSRTVPSVIGRRKAC